MKYKTLYALLLAWFALACKPTRINNNNINNLQIEDCGTGPNYYRALQVNPRFRNAANRIEDFTKIFIQNRHKNIASEDRTEDYVIPVVVHVVWTSAEENISMEQIERGIEQLNQNYNAANPAASGIPAAFLSLTGNPHIRFKLALRDPSCNATDGVVRVQNTGSISLNPIEEPDDPLFQQLVHNPVKQLAPAWPMDKYLNIWICRLTGGLNGYSSLPGMPANVDGVVIRHGCMGDNGTAATATLRAQTVLAHEVGHWLNLRHTWGDDDYDPPFTSPFARRMTA